MIWADNIYLVASSVSQLLSMFDDVSECIYVGKLKWKTTELEYTTGSNIPSCGNRLKILPDGETAEIKFAEEIVVLGTNLDRRGSTPASMNHRLIKAEGCYGGMASLLKDRGTPGKERLDAWSRGPVSSALYGVGGWSLSGHNLHDLRRWENKHIRGFMKFGMRPEVENRQKFYQRTNGMINRLLLKNEVVPIFVRALRQMHNWAYTWWTFSQDDGTQPLKSYLNIRPAAQWSDVRATMEQVDYANASGWRHQYSGKRLQWEDLYNEHLPEWRHILENAPDTWYTHRDRVIRNICDKANLQSEGFVKTNNMRRGNNKQQRKIQNEINPDQWQFDGGISEELRHRPTEQEERQGSRTVETITDNEALADIIGGRAKPEFKYETITDDILGCIAEIYVRGQWGPKSPAADAVRWMKREFNKESDFLANYAMDSKEDFVFTGNLQNIDLSNGHLIGWSDGGSRIDDNCASCAWILKHINATGQVQVIGAAATYLSRSALSSLEVECKAMRSLWHFIEDVVFNKQNVNSRNSLSKFNAPNKRRRLSNFPAST
jgi:hypothetical protein